LIIAYKIKTRAALWHKTYRCCQK